MKLLQNMRIFGAWLFLSVTLFHWIGTLLCFEAVYYIETRHNMNALEQALANAIQTRTGAEATIKVLDADTLLPKGYVYGNYFAFSEEVEGQTVFYTVIEPADAATYEAVSVPPANPLTDCEQAILLKSLLYECILTASWQLNVPLPPLQTDCFLLTAAFSSAERTILAPPPDALF